VTEKIAGLQAAGQDHLGHVTVTVEKYRHIVEVDIQSHGATLHAKEETHDMYSSIDQVLDKIEIQAKRLKEKVKTTSTPRRGRVCRARRRGRSASPAVFVAETFAPKPLSVDEAVEDLQGARRCSWSSTTPGTAR